MSYEKDIIKKGKHLACIKTNRKYIGIEMNENYVELSRKRINDLVNSNT